MGGHKPSTEKPLGRLPPSAGVSGLRNALDGHQVDLKKTSMTRYTAKGPKNPNQRHVLLGCSLVSERPKAQLRARVLWFQRTACATCWRSCLGAVWLNTLASPWLLGSNFSPEQDQRM